MPLKIFVCSQAIKHITHHQLMTELFTELSRFFAPKDKDIKQCLDALIEREYLERTVVAEGDDISMSTYTYLD